MKRILSILSACAITGGLYAQSIVSTAPSNKNVLLEDFTGIYCGYCPDGARIADEFKAANPGRVVIIGNHAGYYATPNGSPNHLDMRTNEGTQIDGLADPSGYPAGNINRMVTNYSMKPGKTAMSRGYWTTVGGSVHTQASVVNLAAKVHYYPGENKLYIYIEGYYTGNGTGSDYLTVAVLQDNVEGYQGSGSTYPQRVLPSGLYNHMDVLRTYVTGSTSVFGEEISTTTMGSFFTRTYTYNVAPIGPDVIPDITNMHVSIWMTTDQGYSEVITAIDEHAVAQPVGVNEATSLNDLNIYPNPFENNATIEFNLDRDQEITINFFDVTGKVIENVPSTVYTTGNHKIDFNGSNLNGGLYYVNIVAEDGIVTRKLILNK